MEEAEEEGPDEREVTIHQSDAMTDRKSVPISLCLFVAAF